MTQFRLSPEWSFIIGSHIPSSSISWDMRYEKCPLPGVVRKMMIILIIFPLAKRPEAWKIKASARWSSRWKWWSSSPQDDHLPPKMIIYGHISNSIEQYLMRYEKWEMTFPGVMRWGWSSRGVHTKTLHTTHCALKTAETIAAQGVERVQGKTADGKVNTKHWYVMTFVKPQIEQKSKQTY